MQFEPPNKSFPNMFVSELVVSGVFAQCLVILFQS